MSKYVKQQQYLDRISDPTSAESRSHSHLPLGAIYWEYCQKQCNLIKLECEKCPIHARLMGLRPLPLGIEFEKDSPEERAKIYGNALSLVFKVTKKSEKDSDG